LYKIWSCPGSSGGDLWLPDQRRRRFRGFPAGGGGDLQFPAPEQGGARANPSFSPPQFWSSGASLLFFLQDFGTWCSMDAFSGLGQCYALD
jgi:hypothetical protein